MLNHVELIVFICKDGTPILHKMGVWLFCAFLTFKMAELFKMFSFNCENYTTSDMPKRPVLDPSPKCQDQDRCCMILGRTRTTDRS